MTFDLLGNPVSYGARDAIDALDAASEKFLAYRTDPFADVEAILAAHPRFLLAHCFRAGLIATATDRTLDGELAKSLDAARALGVEANDRERGHIAALEAWAAGDWAQATAVVFDTFDGVSVTATVLSLNSVPHLRLAAAVAAEARFVAWVMQCSRFRSLKIVAHPAQVPENWNGTDHWIHEQQK